MVGFSIEMVSQKSLILFCKHGKFYIFLLIRNAMKPQSAFMYVIKQFMMFYYTFNCTFIDIKSFIFLWLSPWACFLHITVWKRKIHIVLNVNILMGLKMSFIVFDQTFVFYYVVNVIFGLLFFLKSNKLKTFLYHI